MRSPGPKRWLALVGLVSALALLTSLAPSASAQTTGGNVEKLLLPASTFGDGWKEIERKVDSSKAEVSYVPGSVNAPKGGEPTPPFALVTAQNYPDKDKLEKDFAGLAGMVRSEEHTSELQSPYDLV